jgi:gliding motility-associated-like protein/uncharacterized delta-60 repeat protein
MKHKFSFFLFIVLLFPTVSIAQTGNIDSSFNKLDKNPGKVLLSNLQANLGAISTDKKGRIVCVSFNMEDNSIHVMRVLASGIIDTTFNGGYSRITSSFMQSVTSVAVQADNKILIGGGRSNGNFTNMYVLRLNENGLVDSTFFGSGYSSPGLGIEVQKIQVQRDGKIIVAGKDINNVAIVRLNYNGTVDRTFGSGKGFFLSDTTILSVGGLAMDDANNIYIAGAGYGYATVLKLLSSGDKFINFGKQGKTKIDFPYISFTSGIALQSDGKIIIGASDNESFISTRLNSQGGIDTTFGNNKGYFSWYTGTRYNNLFLQKDGKIIMSGSTDKDGYNLVKLLNTGVVDSTFGLYGNATFYGNPIISQTYPSSDGKVYFYGQEYGGFYLYKVLTNPVLNIIGHGFVFPKSVERYTVKVSSTWPSNVDYTWVYSGNGTLLIPNSTGSTVSILFSENATNGKLRCIAKNVNGAIIGYQEMDVVVNSNANAAGQLADLQCTPGVSDCSGSYIDLFQLNKTRNVTPGCSNNGYSDFTPSNYTDTLYIGGVYSAKLKVGGEGIRYVSMWIDYNNDGVFNSTDEYIGSGVSDNSAVDVNNIVFKNALGYEGPKRLRVRCRAEAQFKPEESCPMSGDAGETEDYLVVIQRQSLLEAPQIITPNEDGKNDYFVIRGIDPSSSNKLVVFDRTGKVKFSADNYENNWNGVAADGEKLLPGTYYYLFTNNEDFVRGFLEIRY